MCVCVCVMLLVVCERLANGIIDMVLHRHMHNHYPYYLAIQLLYM